MPKLVAYDLEEGEEENTQTVTTHDNKLRGKMIHFYPLLRNEYIFVLNITVFYWLPNILKVAALKTTHW